MNDKEAKELLERYRMGLCTDEERIAIEAWVDQEVAQQPWNISAREKAEFGQSLKNRIDQARNTEYEKVVSPRASVLFRLWPRIAAAAAILLVAGAGLVFYTSYYAARHLEGSEATRDLLNYANDIAPGKNTATITLGNGSTIVLSDAKTGVVVGAESLRYNDGSAVDANDSSRHLDDRRTDQRELNETANNNNSSELTDQRELNETDKNNINSELNPLNSTGKRSLPGGRDDEKVEMASVTTPRGGTYQITLPDGSHVWLNAASSVKFPAKFTGNMRRVELSGEAYFEVAKDKEKPFIVESNGQQVEVLGTHFNISAYKDEASVKTTLLEGSVRIVLSSRGKRSDENRALRELSAAKPLGYATSRDLSYRRDDGGGRNDGQGAAIILKPNQQAVLTGSKQLTVKEVNAASFANWKDGVFTFKNEGLRSVMRKISRWYDVEVEYAGAINETATYSGTISRFTNISNVLKLLKENEDIRFKVEGKRITVSTYN
jgi:ferric-dicitrate binding protein FerR (iron transport regulator)